jgi:hypothetical protein
VRARRAPPTEHRDLAGGEDVGRHLADRHVDPARQPDRQHRGEGEHRGGGAELPAETEQRGDAGAQPAEHATGGQPEHRHPRVGRRQRHRRREHPGDDGRAQHVEALGQHQDAQCRGVQRQVVERGGHQHGQQRPAGQAGGQRPTAAVLEPVEDRADHRRQQHERRHGHQQVERHVAALGVHRGGEEERAGQ